jgi:general secretion pathway protein E
MSGILPFLDKLLNVFMWIVITGLICVLLLLYGGWFHFLGPIRMFILPYMRLDSGYLFNVAGSMGGVLVAAYITHRTLTRRSMRTSFTSERQIQTGDLSIDRHATLNDLKRMTSTIDEMGNRDRVNSVRLFNELISVGFSVGASDIHISPERDRTRIVFRIDGVLHGGGTISPENTPYLVNRIKILANLAIHIHARPQDGAISFDTDEYQLRVSTLPTNHGEKVVIRLSSRDESRFQLDRIGFDPETLTLYRNLLSRDHGVIYLTGPTGSGKTTTMYASMLHIRENRGSTINMATLEDPVEVDLSRIAQTQVDPASGLTFAVGLRSILRQDPDVIMVGEIRDEETARVSIHAGLTGHLLFTSVHADSSAGVINRLKQLKVDPSRLASASLAVVNQRLALANCPLCLTKVLPTPYQENQLRVLNLDFEGSYYAGKGCDSCSGTGRMGRIPLLEVLKVTDRIKDLIVRDMPTHRLMEAAVEEGMVTLTAQALRKAKQGILPIDEAIRILSIG